MDDGAALRPTAPDRRARPASAPAPRPKRHRRPRVAPCPTRHACGGSAQQGGSTPICAHAHSIRTARRRRRTSGDRTNRASAIPPARLPTKGNAMDWNIIEGNWKQFKGHVKEKWGKLTDDHLDEIAGKREQLSGRLQESYGITKDQAEREVKAFEELHKDYEPTTPA
jgi:uncharacterized protein YjbJ (UPF0337 family)